MRARRLSRHVADDEAARTLDSLARDFDEIAEDLERGAVEIRHPSLLPQHQ